MLLLIYKTAGYWEFRFMNTRLCSLRRIVQSLLIAFCCVSSAFASAQTEEKSDDATKLFALWKSLKATNTGIYTKNGKVFVYVARDWFISSKIKHEQWAKRDSDNKLFRWVNRRNVRQLDDIGQRLLERVSVTLPIAGHVVTSGQRDNQYEQVTCYDLASVQNAVSQISVTREVAKVANVVAKSSENYSQFFAMTGSDELSLLAALKQYRGPLFTVSTPLIQYRSVLSGAKDYFLMRDRVLESTPVPTWLGNRMKFALDCVEKKKEFQEELKKVGISSGKFNYTTPILRQVEACQGFVTMNPFMSDKKPRSMKKIYELFNAGKELKLAICLLEAAVEESPRSAEAWEYLTAAYEAAKMWQKARVAGRVWYLLEQRENPEALISVLRNSESENRNLYRYFKDFK